jgi:DNA-directed RNA polymerase specialized sigma24 family protein
MTTAVADVPDREVAAFRGLLERWFDSCVDVAWQVLHDADAAATVAQDTFFAAWHAHTARKPSAEAGAWVLRAARDGALGRLAQARHQAPGAEPWPSSGAPTVSSARDRDAGADLVRATFAALGEADASVLDLHLRHGFGVPELAQALGVPRHDAQELVLRLNRKLGRALRAWALWPGSRPGGSSGCPELRQALEANGVRTFGPEAVAEIARHTKACERCQDRQRLADSPEAIYAAVPVVPAGTMLAAATAEALADRGIPLGGEPSSPPLASAAPSPDAAVVAASAALPPPPGPSTDHAPAAAYAVSAASQSATGAPTAATWAARPAPPGDDQAGKAPWAAPGAAGDHTGSAPTAGAATTWAAPATTAGEHTGSAHAATAATVAAPATAAGEHAGSAPTAGAATTWAGPATTAAASAGPAATPEATWASPPGDPYGPAGDGGGAHFGGASGEPTPRPGRGLKALAALVIVAVLAAGAAAAIALSGGDPTPTTAPSTTAGPTTSAPSTTADPTSTTTSEATTTTAGPTTTASDPAITTTTGPDGATTTTAATGEPPTIVGFRVASVTLGRPCADTERRITLTWQATSTDGVQISGEGAPAGALPATGQATACRASGPPVTYTLTASGPGGTDTATVSA